MKLGFFTLIGLVACDLAISSPVPSVKLKENIPDGGVFEEANFNTPKNTTTTLTEERKGDVNNTTGKGTIKTESEKDATYQKTADTSGNVTSSQDKMPIGQKTEIENSTESLQFSSVTFSGDNETVNDSDLQQNTASVRRVVRSIKNSSGNATENSGQTAEYLDVLKKIFTQMIREEKNGSENPDTVKNLENLQIMLDKNTGNNTAAKDVKDIVQQPARGNTNITQAQATLKKGPKHRVKRDGENSTKEVSFLNDSIGNSTLGVQSNNATLLEDDNDETSFVTNRQARITLANKTEETQNTTKGNSAVQENEILVNETSPRVLVSVKNVTENITETISTLNQSIIMADSNFNEFREENQPLRESSAEGNGIVADRIFETGTLDDTGMIETQPFDQRKPESGNLGEESIIDVNSPESSSDVFVDIVEGKSVYSNTGKQYPGREPTFDNKHNQHATPIDTDVSRQISPDKTNEENEVNRPSEGESTRKEEYQGHTSKDAHLPANQDGGGSNDFDEKTSVNSGPLEPNPIEIPEKNESFD